MAKYIDREAALEAASEGISGWGRTEGIEKDVLNEIRKVPAADVAPVRHGRWEFKPETLCTRPGYECTACKGPTWLSPDVPQAFKYCPHCGAKMDGEACNEACRIGAAALREREGDQ